MNGQELKTLREKYNLTQQEVADGVNCKQTRISEWENGKYSISKAYKQLLSVFFTRYKN
jgi:transcriptional regulator with XRE-family HTH domain